MCACNIVLTTGTGGRSLQFFVVYAQHARALQTVAGIEVPEVKAPQWSAKEIKRSGTARAAPGGGRRVHWQRHAHTVDAICIMNMKGYAGDQGT